MRMPTRPSSPQLAPESADGLPRELARCVERVRGRWVLLRAAEGLVSLLGTSALLVLVTFAIDNLLRPGSGGRWALLAAGLGGAAAVFAWKLLRPIFRPPGVAECALLLEREQPDLDDRFVNAVHFGASDPDRYRGFSGAVVELVASEATGRIDRLRERELLRAPRLRRLGSVAAVAVLLVAVYAALLPGHFSNAALRLSRPWRYTPAVSDTRLLVEPGDARIRPGEDLTVEVAIEGRLPAEARIESSLSVTTPMLFDGRVFRFVFSRPAADFTYRVMAGDAASDRFRVRVLRPPEIRSLAVTVESPEYTGWPPRRYPESSGSLSALVGSRILLDVIATAPVERGWFVPAGGTRPDRVEMERQGEDRLRVSWLLEEDVDYGLLLEGSEGLSPGGEEATRHLTALPDNPPECEIVQPGRDLEWEIARGALPVTLRAGDDVGLREVVLQWAPSGAANAWRAAARWDLDVGEREVVPSTALEIRKLLVSLDVEEHPLVDALVYRAVASDRAGQETRSRAFRVRLLSEVAAATRRAEELARARQGLAEIVRRERAIHRETRRLHGLASGADVPADARRLAEEQDAVRELALELVARWGEGWLPTATRASREDVARAARDLMPTVSRELVRSAEAGAGLRRGSLELALRTERRILLLLERALEGVERVPRAGDSGASSEGDEAPGTAPERLRGADDQLRQLISDLERFAEEQRDVVARTQELAEGDPDDFTGEEKEALEELAAIEETWGKYLEEAATDLSKVAPQDMSLSTLAEEVVELVEEVDLAKDYLTKQNVELAVPTEQAGAQLAEEIEANLERWLMRERDRLKWVMEEPTGEFDVPLADLPSELEDIVGDLIDQEELMGAETEDITSSWLDSMDEGIGWDAMDGPISNMSAKGVTGNLQPNDMEIGGRSGEGRSGKSMGQFVEVTATGKGGRQTPTRSTPDPFEGGEVQDSGTDPTGGSTGGGKLSGVGEQGLRGKPSPELARRLEALAGQQTRIRQKGEQLDLALRRRRYYSQNLERAVDLMRRMEDALRAERPFSYRALRRRIVSELETTQRVIEAQRDVRLEAGLRSAGPFDEELRDAGGEEAPREYRDLIRDYYRAISAGGEAR